MVSYSEMFRAATGHGPYPYQKEFATRLDLPSLLSVPTGCGKTAAVILGWLWQRRFAGSGVRQATPRRLVYCLPMRVLVEQTRDCAVTWLHRLGWLGGEAMFERAEKGDDRLTSYDPWAGTDDPDKIRVHLLMGGDVDRDWDRFPERDAILIGTQDMLLSRALNRGYAMSRFRWPVQFALLNNDCLWVMDEVQLMGSGLATTAQLQAFRRKHGTVSGVRSVWMSATMRPEWLATVDFDQASDAPGSPIEIGEADKSHEALRPRFEAFKQLTKAPFEATADGEAEAELALRNHTAGTRTLVVVNTVKRSQAIYQALRNRNPASELVLVHSRFRPLDRKAALDHLIAEPGENGTIGVCTQVVEAGVDVSAKTLITDLAPWASLVQRFGRCNRKGEFNESEDAKVIWIAPEGLQELEELEGREKPTSKDENRKGELLKSLAKESLPYRFEDLRAARSKLANQLEVGPASLPPPFEDEEPITFSHVVRRKDIVELFDTTPDLAGADIDVSRFIRETDEHDVQVFWRDVPEEEEPSPGEPGPAREELCSVPVGNLREWLKRRSAWRRDHLEKKWVKPGTIYPGLVLMLRACEGGYSLKLGWTGQEKRTEEIEAASCEAEGYDDDGLSQEHEWATIAEHTNGVVEGVARLLSTLTPNLEPWGQAVLTAARWHDAGKAHPVFQKAIPAEEGEGSAGTFWAKSKPKMKPYKRPGFRHELASAIAMLQNGQSNLEAYLVAAHHGKVRLSIRSLPHERPDDPEKRFARGVWEGDVLPRADLGGGIVTPETTLKLGYMELGENEETGSSWLTRMLKLREELGLFRLAYLEALLRVADWRASGKAGSSDNGGEVDR